MRHVVLPTRGRRCSRQTVLLLALALLAPATAFAQISEPLHFGVGGGFALPTGNNPNDLETGFQIEAAIQAGPHYLPVTLRLEALFARFAFTYIPHLPCVFPGCSPVTEQQRILGGTLNVLLERPMPALGVAPYLIVGGGVFNHEDGAGAARSGGETGPVELRLWQLPARRPVR